MENQNPMLTDTEISALAEKVEDWSRGLTARERTFMADVLVRAVSNEPADIQGYGVLPIKPNATISRAGFDAGAPGDPNDPIVGGFVWNGAQIASILQTFHRIAAGG